MYRLPDAEVERYLHPRLHLVVCLGNLDLDRDPIRVRRDVAYVRNAVGAPQEADEILGEVGIAQSHVHLSHCLRRPARAQVWTCESDDRATLSPWPS